MSSRHLNWDVKSPVKSFRFVTQSRLANTDVAMPPPRQVICSCTDCRRYTFLTPSNQLIHGKLVSPNTRTAHSRRNVVVDNTDQVNYNISNYHRTH